ncbi:MoxR-like ATPase [Methanomicrobium sp. W14]|uniref:AAA family ATPase n=1 Tax=Methanomicrobium sp. W14 TaxID=2817839 RepID=UPI001AE47CF4|nr:MoxR family ATPase [Methanomicrobium sp. W14]MBP2133123.1 MoxR-like ATPase [Methanomicrobium sp. W14]
MTNNKPDNDVRLISETYNSLKAICSEFIVGNERLIESVFTGLLSGGHVLIEGYPGTAKTSVIKIIARLLGCETKRIQCTVDMQPSDILGVRIWNSENKTFELREGPIFTNILLIDEINRLPPRSQSAFIEAMSEKQATLDGITIPLKTPFFAIATQNPIEHEGVFPLIEAQKDRFMLRVRPDYLTGEDELEIIKRENKGILDINRFLTRIQPILTPEGVEELQEIVKTVKVSDPVLNYIKDIVIASREHSDIKVGISSRGSIALLRGAKSYAAIKGRDYVIPDDVKYISKTVVPHRLLLTYEAEISGLSPETVLRQIFETIEVP